MQQQRLETASRQIAREITVLQAQLQKRQARDPFFSTADWARLQTDLTGLARQLSAGAAPDGNLWTHFRNTVAAATAASRNANARRAAWDDFMAHPDSYLLTVIGDDPQVLFTKLGQNFAEGGGQLLRRDTLMIPAAVARKAMELPEYAIYINAIQKMSTSLATGSTAPLTSQP